MHLWPACVLSSRGLISPGDNRNTPLHALRTTWICVSRLGSFFSLRKKRFLSQYGFYIILCAHTDNPLLVKILETSFPKDWLDLFRL